MTATSPIPERSFERNYTINQTVNLPLDATMQGYIACSGDDSQMADPYTFLDAVDKLGDKAEQGIIGILRAEYRYTSFNVFAHLIEAGVPVNALLTFGANSYSSRTGDTHLSIFASEMQVPFAFVKKPWYFRGAVREASWMVNRTLPRLQGKLGSLTMNKSGRTIRLAVPPSSTDLSQ